MIGSQETDSGPVWTEVGVTVTEGGRVVGLAMHTPPHRLFVARMPEPAAAALAEALADQRRPLSGVNGESAVGASFAAAWQERTGDKAVVDVRMRMYRLEELKPPADVPGKYRLANFGDTEVAAEWAAAFHDEAQPQAPSEDWSAWAVRRIDPCELHLWVSNGTAVAMAARSAPAGAECSPPFDSLERSPAQPSAKGADPDSVVLRPVVISASGCGGEGSARFGHPGR